MRAVVRDRARNVGVAGARVQVHADEVVVDLLSRPFALDDLHAAVLGDEVGVDDRHVLFSDRTDEALDHGGLERRRVVVRDLAEVFDLDVAELTG